MGWYDANPVHLNPTPPVETGRRYVAAMGGPAKVIAMAQASYDAGDYAWAAELLNREVMADGGDVAAKALLARCYDQLGWQSENSLWRNIYLTGSAELRNGVPPPAPASASQSAVLANLPTASLFDLLAVRLDADKAGAATLKLEFVFPDRQESTYVTVENGVLIHQPIAAPGPVDATFTVKRSDFLAALFGGGSLAAKVASGQATITGNPGALLKLTSWMDKPAPNFPIVTR
jgi:alkyl sulfatase BDS1-like metallo-beta-lactamase superfamily hydrolase